jgi:hypothetical protein
LRRLLPVAALAASCLLTGAVARAEPSPAQKETARGLMAEGRDLREAGDFRGALKRFSAADSLMRVPTTGFEVASTQAQLGQLVEARETLRRVLGMPRAADDPEPFNEARSRAQQLDQQLLARIGALRFLVDNAEDVSVSVDGEDVPRAALSMPFRVNPGRHVVVARAGERKQRREIIAVEAETVDVQLKLADRAPASEPAPAAPIADPSPHEPAHRLPTLAYVGGGLAVAGVLAGSVTGISAISHRNAARKDCVNGDCPPSTWSDLDKAQSMATASTVSFAVGAIGLAVAVTSLLLDPKPEKKRAFLVSPDVGSQSAKLTVAGTF